MLKNFNKIQVKNNNFFNQNINPTAAKVHQAKHNFNPKDEIINFIGKYIKSG